MADEQFVTRKDLEDVTQKVAIQNSKDLTKPLVDQQKDNDLKELERSIEQKALFQDIADGIKGVGDSLLNGLKSLIPKTDGGLSKLLGLGLGLLLAPFAAFIGFISQLGTELNFFTKGKAAVFLKNLKLRFTNFWVGIFDKLKKSKLGKFVGDIVDKLKNSKIFKSISGLFQAVFAKGKGFFSKLSSIFKSIVKFATGGPFKSIMKFAGSIGRILGKVFLPITILLGVFDFVKGFMRGYSEGGIIEGIKQGIMDLVDGLIGNLIRILMWIPTKLAEWMGLDNLAKAIGEYTDDIFSGISEVFSNLVDFVKAVFTWDTAAMSETLSDIWDGITKVFLAPFKVIEGLVKDIFGGPAIQKMKLTLASIGLSIQSFFLFLQEGINGLLQKVPDFLLPKFAEDFIDELDDATSSLKGQVDRGKTEIDQMKKNIEADEKKKKEQMRKAKELKEESQTNINTSNNNNAVVNNVTYNVIGPSDLSARALQNANA